MDDARALGIGHVPEDAPDEILNDFSSAHANPFLDYDKAEPIPLYNKPLAKWRSVCLGRSVAYQERGFGGFVLGG